MTTEKIKELKEQKKEEALGFEWIAGMSAQFNERIEQTHPLTPEEASYWQLRILLSISQQLSVIAGVLKETS